MNELQSNITFSDIAAEDGAGITYRRVPSARNTICDQIKQQPPYTPSPMANSRNWSRGKSPAQSKNAPGTHFITGTPEMKTKKLDASRSGRVDNATKKTDQSMSFAPTECHQGWPSTAR